MSSSLKPLVASAWLLMVVLVSVILIGGREVLVRLALAVLLWQLINAIAAFYRRIRIGGWVAASWQALSLGVLTIVLALLFVIDLIVDNVGAVTAAAPTYQANLLALLPHLADFLGLPHPESLGPLVGQVDLGLWIRSISLALVSFTSNIGLVVLYVAFMLLEQATFPRKIDALFPDPAKAASVRGLLHHIESRIERYLWVKTIFSLATAVLSWCVLAAIGCQQAGFWALIIFMINYIPIVGSFFGVVFPSLLVLVQFGALGPFLATVVGLSAVQVSLGNVLEPRFMGSSLNLSPMVIVVSLAVWGSIWGIAGMFLCVPIMVIIVIVCSHFPATRNVAILLSADGRLDEAVAGGAPSRVGATPNAIG